MRNLPKSCCSISSAVMASEHGCSTIGCPQEPIHWGQRTSWAWSGPLTCAPSPTGTRWTAVGKSPLTGTWGDANGSGWFGVALKRAGYDAIFFTGAADRPVYLLVEDRRTELRDATELWGRDCYEIEDWVKAELGPDAEAACIGPAGEKL